MSLNQSTFTSIAQAFGLQGWALNNGSYNGCTFYSLAPIPLLERSQLYKETGNVVASVNQLSGQNLIKLNSDPNGYGKLVSTVLCMQQLQSKLRTNIAIKDLPFANKCNTEQMGFGGWEFKMTLMFFDVDYQKALWNLENAIINPPQNSSEQNVLIHPTRGKISGVTRVLEYGEVIDLSLWNGCTINVTFISEQTNVQEKNNQNTARDITNAIQTALDFTKAIPASIVTAKSLLEGFGNNPNRSPSQIFTALKIVETQSQTLSDVLLNNCAYVYQNSQTSVINTTLSQQVLNPNYLPPSIVGVQNNYISPQVDIIVNNYLVKSNNLIAQIKSYGFGGIMNNIIGTIRQSVASLQDLCLLLLPPNSNQTYQTEYTMSIREVLSLNGIDISLALDILKINPMIPSANYIPKGTMVNL